MVKDGVLVYFDGFSVRRVDFWENVEYYNMEFLNFIPQNTDSVVNVTKETRDGMRRILILATTSDFLEKFETGDVKILKESGYEVHYAANTKEPHPLFHPDVLEAKGIIIHHIDIERSPYLLRNNRRAYLQVCRLIEQYHIQAIHCHTPVGGMIGRLAGRRYARRGLVVIYTAHGFHFYRGAPLLNNTAYYLVERLLARFTDYLVVINREDYVSARKLHLRPGGKVLQIPGVGLDLAKFAPAGEERRKAMREALGMGEEDFFLVSVGELNENKNQELVLRMLAKLQTEQKGTPGGTPVPRVRYGICGDGFCREKIDRLSAQLGLQDVVTVYGFRTDVPEVLGCADALVFPSKREGLGMAALEALAMGIPVLASDNRGTREYMEDGKNGYLCDSGDPDSFLRNLKKLWDRSPEETEAMKAYCRETAVPFDMLHAGKVMRGLYETVGRRMDGGN